MIWEVYHYQTHYQTRVDFQYWDEKNWWQSYKLEKHWQYCIGNVLKDVVIKDVDYSKGCCYHWCVSAESWETFSELQKSMRKNVPVPTVGVLTQAEVLVCLLEKSILQYFSHLLNIGLGSIQNSDQDEIFKIWNIHSDMRKQYVDDDVCRHFELASLRWTIRNVFSFG